MRKLREAEGKAKAYPTSMETVIERASRSIVGEKVWVQKLLDTAKQCDLQPQLSADKECSEGAANFCSLRRAQQDREQGVAWPA